MLISTSYVLVTRHRFAYGWLDLHTGSRDSGPKPCPSCRGHRPVDPARGPGPSALHPHEELTRVLAGPSSTPSLGAWLGYDDPGRPIPTGWSWERERPGGGRRGREPHPGPGT
jgi:hypothetical protein